MRKSQVLDILGEFSCRCEAASARGRVQSAFATVDIACKYCNVVLIFDRAKKVILIKGIKKRSLNSPKLSSFAYLIENYILNIYVDKV